MKPFAPSQPIHVARAPGRLDVMGGIADYSGALVLQLPIAHGARARVQRRDDAELHAWSSSPDGSRSEHVALELGDLGLPDRPIDYVAARALFAARPQDHWASYVLGAPLVLAREHGVSFTRGVSVVLESDVPEGKGVSSSAAIEVATMQAMAALHGRELAGRELALACQRVENEIAGAPCGVMDQMTAACGEQGKLLALRCQPCEVEGHIPLPPDLEILGLDSLVRHAVSGSDYATVRAGAFIGYRMLAERRGLAARSEGATVAIDDPQWRGYLANCPLEEWRARWRDELPATVGGAEFLRRFLGSTDRATAIDPSRTYAVRDAAGHPIEENARAQRFRALLGEPVTGSVLEELGDLMLASHASYSRLGLGCEATDWIVEQVRHSRARGGGLLGARITGGGSGGTVAILGEVERAAREVERIARALGHRGGRQPIVFRGS